METPIIQDLKSNQTRLDSIVEKHKNLDAEDLLSLAAATAQLNRAIMLLAERTIIAQKMNSNHTSATGW